MADLLDDLKTLIRTRHAIVTIHTLDEEYAARMIRQAGKVLRTPVLEWSATAGLHRVSPTESGLIANTESLAGALRQGGLTAQNVGRAALPRAERSFGGAVAPPY